MKGKTTLRKKVNNKDNDPAMESQEYTYGRIIKGKTSLGKNKNRLNNEKQNTEENISQNFIEQIVLIFFASKWQKKVLAMKKRVSSNRPNKKAKDLLYLIHVIERAFNNHTYLYLMELFDNISNIPYPSGLENNPNYGKVFLVKKNEIVIEEPIITNEKTRLRVKKDPNIKEKQNEKNKEEYDEELSIYYYRSDVSLLIELKLKKILID